MVACGPIAIHYTIQSGLQLDSKIVRMKEKYCVVTTIRLKRLQFCNKIKTYINIKDQIMLEKKSDFHFCLV